MEIILQLTCTIQEIFFMFKRKFFHFLNNNRLHAENKIYSILSAVATEGSRGAVPPPNDRLCPPVLVYSEYVFGTSRNNKTKDNNGKRNNKVQT